MVKTKGMRKKTDKGYTQRAILSALVLFISFAFVTAFMVEDLMFINLEGSNASGKASILSVRSTGENMDNVRVNFDVDNLYNDDDELFEVWIVDLDSGYKLSVGSFSTNENGRESFSFTQKIVNFKIYDMIVVTMEDVDDFNPYPNQAVLFAEIPGSDRRSMKFSANLTGNQQNPGVDTNASGFGEFFMNKTDNTLRYDIHYTGLMGNETFSHIHGFSVRDVNSNVLFNLSLGESKSGIWNYSEPQEEKIVEGLTYVNVHSDMFPNGEIGGQILKNDEDFSNMFNISNMAGNGGVHIGGNLSVGIV
ncbi:MAG: CHRD domain-containing protein [Nanoarchaeota archaeon]